MAEQPTDDDAGKQSETTASSPAHEANIFGVPIESIRYAFAFAAAALIAVFIGAVYTINLYVVISSGIWVETVKEHFAAILGLPSAALVAFFVVLIFSNVSGPIEVEFYGVKFKGAATPVIFWIVCFVCISMMIKLLW